VQVGQGYHAMGSDKTERQHLAFRDSTRLKEEGAASFFLTAELP